VSEAPRTGSIPAANAALFYREIGEGRPLVVLHGGPDFDHQYLLPDMDRLSDRFRLIYYDQRGRGRSLGSVHSDEVTLASEIADLERVPEFFGLQSIAVLGHSWGGLLAMEYAIRHPDRVSHMILMNCAPASRDDLLSFQQRRRQTQAADLDRMAAIAATSRYQAGDLDAENEYYRLHFRLALRKPEILDRLLEHLRRGATPAAVLTARAIEHRLYDDTWNRDGYSTLPRLTALRIPTLVLHGDHDLFSTECARHIAGAIPGARCVVLEDCGHFAYMEQPEAVRRAIAEFLGNAH
jgi:proline iminopeptidase